MKARKLTGTATAEESSWDFMEEYMVPREVDRPTEEN